MSATVAISFVDNINSIWQSIPRSFSDVGQLARKVAKIALKSLQHLAAFILCLTYSGTTTVGLAIGFTFPEHTKPIQEAFELISYIPFKYKTAFVVFEIGIIHFLGAPVFLPLMAGFTSIYYGRKVRLEAEVIKEKMITAQQIAQQSVHTQGGIS